MKVLLVNGSPHKEGCTYTALSEVAKTLNAEGIDEIKPSQLGDRYRLKSYYILADKVDVSLQVLD